MDLICPWTSFLASLIFLFYTRGVCNLTPSCKTVPLSIKRAHSSPQTNSASHYEFQSSEETLIWRYVSLKNRQCASSRPQIPEKDSSVVLFKENRCLARSPAEVLHICKYLYSLNTSLESPSIANAIFPQQPGNFPWTVVDQAKRQKSPKVKTKERETKSELWRKRFESLEKFRDQLKDPPLESKSTNELMESIEADDVGEWINFASTTSGAKVVGANPEARNAIKVIDGRKETFMKNDCKAEQWLIIELSNIAGVKFIEMTMKELYSSRIASVAVYGRLSSLSKNPIDYPSKFRSEKWTFLTELHPENKKGTQHFPVREKGWVKYLGFHILKYHGTGRACTINDISIFGLSPVNNLETLLNSAVQEEDTHTENRNNKQPSVSTIEPQQSESVSQKKSHSVDDQCLEVKFEDIATEESSSNQGKQLSRTLSVSSLKKMHQDVQNLKSSTSVLSQYVDELHSSLMQTIGELWASQDKTKSSTLQLNEQLSLIQRSLQSLETRMAKLEESQDNQNKKARAWMGVLGVTISIVGLLALRSSYFGPKSWILSFLIYMLCSLNFLVACLSLISVIRPTLLLKLHRLKREIPVVWQNLFSI